ncbi:glycosyltransferase family 4 protein [Sulfuriroseicoccus oceanibius]|uniref:Glycosyltransferase family 4 protein n=1 Tax=Sulfuriroseicoccus oceanibius TaxID=2707525 RepID=A0A6B3L4M9_9BACT|nr:glycosyltransferase family 4 protein [Sulfuriroseicoccus oceanibius]QQL45124.1 glycosyltransferase family 4 protein [Sulfuriroseicoccus oceanibius]
MSERPHFAYVFQRFPSFTQTFCVREVLEQLRQGVRLALFSITDTRDEAIQHFPKELVDQVEFLPERDALVDQVKQWKREDKLPKEAVLTLRHWGDQPDKRRVYEAIYVGQRLQQLGVRHVHSHFAGLGARTCWWIRQFYGATFSFTAHANDIFCPEPGSVTLEQLMHDASRVVTVSDFTARYLENEFPQAAARVRRVYNGLDLAPIMNYQAAESVADGGPPLIFSVGRLIEKKGFADLIRACGILKKRGISFRCEIAGDGPLEDELNALRLSEGVEDEVRLVGPKSQDWIIPRLHQTAVFALPCVVEKDGGMDNLPTVIMEAMAASLPVVSTVLAGVPEMVIDGESGYLVDPHDYQKLAERIADVLADPKRGGEMGAAGCERAQALFAKEVTAVELRRSLVSGGLVGVEASWLFGRDGMLGAFCSQLALRGGRLFGQGCPKRQYKD